MSLKINPSLSLELAEDTRDDRFLLLGHETLESYVPAIRFLKDALFSEHYETGDHLLYQASFVYQGRDHFQEVGLGIFIVEDDKYYIKRERPLYTIDESGNIGYSDKLLEFFCDKISDEKVVISAYLPRNVKEVLYLPHTIITCESPHLPVPVEINKNSLLGRLNENIESIDIATIFTPNNVLSVLTKFTRMIKLMCSVFDVKKLRTAQLDFRPSAKPAEKEGACYFDKQDKTLKYYNGTGWISLK